MARANDAHSVQSSRSRPPTMLSRVAPSLVAVPATAAPATATAAGIDQADDALWRTPAARRAERTWALQHERTVLRDPGQRRYVAGVERVLVSFDSVGEWADFIAFLTRLAKAVQMPAAAGQAAVPAIPQKHVVAKRLAQCLNPALPGGVHAKALEVYALIFTRIGRDGLRRDLGVWTPGLLPFYAAAGLSSRGQIVEIFTRFYLPLGGDDLRPLAAAFVAAILPGLDDEAAEHADATNRLLDRLASLIGLPAFASALWLVTTSTANVRRAALNLTLRRFPKFSSTSPTSTTDLEKALGTDRGLMPRALAACLRAGGLLERRLALDVLVTKLPLSSGLFPRLGTLHTDQEQNGTRNTIDPADALLLVDAAARVVLRRDVSLNRRLYAWLLGSAASGESDASGQEEYLRSYTLPLLSRTLVQALERFHYPPLALANQQAEPGEPQETHRMFIALLDKWEIGGALTLEIILDILAAFWASAPELLRATSVPPTLPSGPVPVNDLGSASVGTTEKMLLAAVDPHVLYTQLAQAIQQEMVSYASTPLPETKLSKPAGTALLGFVLNAFPVTDDEERTVHVPAMLSLLLSHASNLLNSFSSSQLEQNDRKVLVSRALFVAQLALKHTAPSVFSFHHGGASDSSKHNGLSAALNDLYGSAGSISRTDATHDDTKGHQRSSSARAQDGVTTSDQPASDPPSSNQESTRTIGSEMWTPATVLEVLRTSEQVLSLCLQDDSLDGILKLRAASILRGLLRALDAAARSTGRDERLVVRWLPDNLAKIALQRLNTSASVDVTQALVEVLVECATCRALERPLQLGSRPAVQLLTDRLLSLVGAEEANHVSAATTLFLALQQAAPPNLVESCLTSRLVAGPAVAAPPALTVATGRLGPMVEQGSESLAWRVGLLWLQLDERGADMTFLHGPVRLILMGLRGPPGVAHRQIASSWIRAYVKSFARVVGPILSDALNVQVITRPTANTSSSADHPKDDDTHSSMFPARVCTQPADTAALSSSVALLVSVIKEGGNAALRAMSSAMVGGMNIGSSGTRTQSSELLGTAAAKVGIPGDASLLDAAVVMAASLLATNAADLLQASATSGWTAVHAAAADLIQAIAARQSLPTPRAGGVLAVLSRAVRRAASERNVLTQDSLLRALHDVLYTRVPAFAPSSNGRDSPTETRHARRSSDDGLPLATALGPSQVVGLLHILKHGIVPANKAALTHWSDFALSILPAVKGHAKTLLAPLAQHLTGIVERDTALLSGQSLPKSDDGPAHASDSEVATHVALAERVVLMCVEDAMPASLAAADTMSVRSGQRDSTGGLLGYVTRATGGDGNLAPVEGVRSGNMPLWAAELLHKFVADAQSAWRTSTAIEQASTTPRDNRASDIRLLTAIRTRSRCRRALERLYRLAPADTILSLIGSAAHEHWSKDRTLQKVTFDPVLFDILPALTPSPAVAINLVNDVVTGRRKAAHLHVSDILLLAFVTAYAARLDGAGAAGVWPIVAAMGRDILGNSATGVPVRLIDSILRAATALATAASKDASFAADRRFRKDVQDQVAKALDLSVVVAGRAIESSASSASDSLVGGALLFSRRPTSAVSNIASSDDSDVEPDGLITYIARESFRALRQLGIDADRLSASTSNAVYYLIIPALRSKAKDAAPNIAVLQLLQELTTMGSTLKNWRSIVHESFTDGRFFSQPQSAAKVWAPILCNTYTLDKERMIDTIARVGAAPSANINIFANREAETRLRALNVRRLAFLVYAGEVDHWLPQLPMIQERVVDLLKANAPPPVQVETWLVLRILFTRFNGQHLSPLWPNIIAEMLSTLEPLTDPELALIEGSDKIQIIWAVAKFLDLMLTLQIADFQIHQWLFVTDTSDVLYPPEGWLPEGLLERVAAAMVDRVPPAVVTAAQGATPPPLPPSPLDDRLTATVTESSETLARSQLPLAPVQPVYRSQSGRATTAAHETSLPPQRRTPMLPAGESGSLGRLLWFCTQAAQRSYESMYASSVRFPAAGVGQPTGGSTGREHGGVDVAAVDEGLLADMLDG